MSKVTGLFQSTDQVNSLIDSLRNLGFDSESIIVSSLHGQVDPTADANITSSNDMFTETESGEYGVSVSVDVPMFRRGVVAEVMRQYGAVDLKLM